MGSLLLGLIGGVIGGFFGMPQLGFLVGSLVGSFLFPGPGQKGPRLDNLAVTSSAYGTPIFIVYGTVRTSGNIIWATPIKETKHTKKVGSLFGIGGQKVTTYTYSWSGAVAVCEGEIKNVTRIWADTKLVYDTVSPNHITAKKGFKFRVYKGTEDQMPDSAMIKVLGAANTPAHRGMAYILFDNIPLADYGNRVPSFSFEVVAVTNDATQGVHGIIDLVGGPVGTPSAAYILPDWEHSRFYKFRFDGIRAYNMVTRQEVGQATTATIFEPDDDFALGFNGEMCVDDEGYIYAQVSGGGSNTAPIVKINGFTLKEVTRCGTAGNNLNPAGTGTQLCVKGDNLSVVKAITATGVQRYLVNCTFGKAVQFFHVGSLSPSGGLIGYIPDADIDEAKCYGVPGDPEGGSAICWLVGRASFGPESSAPIGIYKVELPGSGYLSVLADNTNPTISTDKIGEIEPSEVVEWWSYFGGFWGAFWDTQEERLFMILDGGRFNTAHTKQLVRYNVLTDEVEQVIPIDVTFSAMPQFGRITNGTLSLIGSTVTTTSSVQTIDLHTGESVTTDNWDFAQTAGGGQTFDSESNSIISAGTTLSTTGETNCIIYTRGGTAATTDGDIVADICDRVGFTSGDIDVSELTDEVRGYIINDQMTARAAIEPLGLAFLFDGVESDDILKFRKRGQTPSFALTQDDLKFVDEANGIVLQETRTQEVELPERMSVVYLDKNTDYQQNTMTAKRVSNPTPTMFSRNQASHTFPMVISADEAKKLAEKLLFTSWIERVQADFQTAWHLIVLDPVDSGTVTLNDGTVYNVRLVGIDAGVDWSMQFKSVSEDATSYSSDATAATSDGFPQQTIPGPTNTHTFLLDIPLLADEDDTGGGASRMYVAAGGFGATGWPGETLVQSIDAIVYDGVASLGDEVSWGVVVGTLAAPADPFVTDEINTLNVRMVAGPEDLVSVTMLEMMNGSNLALVIDETTGIGEIIGFRVVAIQLDGSYTLSGLNRGQRGTDVYTDTHASGETFVLLDTAADVVDSFVLALTALDETRYYKGVPLGTYVEDAAIMPFSTTGRDLKPYAPWAVTAAMSGSDITIDWERRTRINGPLYDGTGTVPLGEASEAYEIDIYNGSTIVRTLTASTTVKTYLAADITSDFGAPITTLKLAVYQMSEAVGRGFTYIQTIDVAP